MKNCTYVNCKAIALWTAKEGSGKIYYHCDGHKKLNVRTNALIYTSLISEIDDPQRQNKVGTLADSLIDWHIAKTVKI